MMKQLFTRSLPIAALAGFLAGSPAEAAEITFDFQNSGGTTVGTGYGNTRSYTVGGVTVTVSSWGVTGNSNTTFQTAQTGWWSGNGLGVCNRGEGTGCSSPEHQVDNNGAREFILFRFSQALDPTKVSIDPYGNWDRDVEYFVGSATTAALTGLAPSAASLGTIGLGSRYTSLSSVSDSARIVSIDGGTSVTALLFGVGPRNSGGFDNDIDRFKLEYLTVQTTPPTPGGFSPPPVPAPASLALLGTALLGLRALRRRRT